MSGARPAGLIFPGEHVLIAFGPGREEFPAELEARLVAAGGVRTATPIRTRPSRAGRLQSVSIAFWVESRLELERLYAVLRDHPEVLFRL